MADSHDVCGYIYKQTSPYYGDNDRNDDMDSLGCGLWGANHSRRNFRNEIFLNWIVYGR